MDKLSWVLFIICLILIGGLFIFVQFKQISPQIVKYNEQSNSISCDNICGKNSCLFGLQIVYQQYKRTIGTDEILDTNSQESIISCEQSISTMEENSEDEFLAFSESRILNCVCS